MYILFNLFINFFRCALVCKRWCRLIKDDSLWKRIDLGLRNIRPGIIGQVIFVLKKELMVLLKIFTTRDNLQQKELYQIFNKKS